MKGRGEDYRYLWVSGLAGLSIGVWLSPKIFELPIGLKVSGAVTAMATAGSAAQIVERLEKELKGERAIAHAQQEMFAARLANQVRATEIELENDLPEPRRAPEQSLEARIQAIREMNGEQTTTE